MFSTLVLCESLEAGELPSSNGYQLMSMFARRFAATPLESVWHGEGASKAFTLSRMMPLEAWEDPDGRQHAGGAHPAGTYFAFRVTFLSDGLEELFLDASRDLRFALDRQGRYALRGSAPLGRCRWACRSTPEALGEGVPLEGVSLRFLAPTGFKSGGLQMLFPLPRLLFGGLLNRWRTFVDAEAWPGLEEELEGVAVASYVLETQAVRGKEGSVLRGCVGQARYDFSGLAPESARACGVLARFAFFSGVGYKTTQGMGQVVPEA